jgi:hypothetical protein
MPARPFADDALTATATALPVPRGLTFRYRPATAAPAAPADVQALLAELLPGWIVRDVPGLPDRFEAIPPALPTGQQRTEPLPLATFWQRLRQLKEVSGVTRVEPLFLVATPQLPAAAAEAHAFGTQRDRFGLWGWPYDRDLVDTIARAREDADWHLRSLRVPQAWAVWRERRPGQEPGEGILVGHPDTGYTDHPEVRDRLHPSRGRNFVWDQPGDEEKDGRDDLRPSGDLPLENPGHGTATASVIVSDRADRSAGGLESLGVAPGARILPLRVSRSVIHFDFGNVGRAILHAAEHEVDVISMSLGGPLSSEFLRECIGVAIERGVIVVAAAGNLLPTTAFPAAFPEVVAVAATHAADEPWRFSGIGRRVDIAAPGEDVWRARAEPTGETTVFDVAMGTGASFATACVAGIAALWLSFHGGREAIAADYGGDRSLVPFAFQLLLAQTARTDRAFVAAGKHGAGLADAERLLRAPLPDLAEVRRFAAAVWAQPVGDFTFFAGLLSGGRAVADRPPEPAGTTATDGERPPARSAPAGGAAAVAAEQEEEATAQAARLRAFAGRLTDDERLELVTRIASDPVLLLGFGRWQAGESRLPLLNRLLGLQAAGGDEPPAGPNLSADLQTRLAAIRRDDLRADQSLHRGRLAPGVRFAEGNAAGTAAHPAAATPSPAPSPATRRLRAYSFDPSLETSLETTRIHEVTIPVRWEALAPGPVGEYLEVIDIDPASQCAYAPVDLNHPHLLAQDGLAPSDRNPQFHQQMVYAFAMTTIDRFERALGRPVFWSNLRPWARIDYPEEGRLFTPESLADAPPPGAPNVRSAAVDGGRLRSRYVQRLRIHPHALREANAYYDPAKRALLFGYFPASDEPTGKHFPGGTVFSCLSHDIIVHETTHALVDGMHPYFNEPSNEDVWAFHEAFADIMALFQHFTYPEVLLHQIADARGDLETATILGRLAQQFGQATGRHGALRDYLGAPDADGQWRRTQPDPSRLERAVEPHERGAILVAAVFDAFLALYNDRVADLLRIGAGGAGVLPPGRLHPDLANRLAEAAAAAAAEVQRACIRALDYVPPVDITFGDFLRALITADYDLSFVPKSRTRVAFINAFQGWGIYPRDVGALSEASLLWRGLGSDAPLQRALRTSRHEGSAGRRIPDRLVAALDAWQPGRPRDEVFASILRAQGALNVLLKDLQAAHPEDDLIPGLDLRPGASFSVGNLRPARRVGPHGEFRTEMVVDVVQTYRPPAEAPAAGPPFRGGATIIVDLESWAVRYVIYKRLYLKLPPAPGAGAGTPVARYERQRRAVRRALWHGEGAGEGGAAQRLAATYSSPERRRRLERAGPFALVHRHS